MLPGFISAPSLSYISLQTALYYHGMISQIPETIYAVSLTRTRQVKTQLGLVSLHHINPDFFFEFTNDVHPLIKMAICEKALLDYFYLSTARSYLFTRLPELELIPKFSMEKAHALANHIPYPNRRQLVINQLARLSPE